MKIFNGITNNYSGDLRMRLSAISQEYSRKNMFIEYANSFMNFKANNDGEESVTKPDTEPVKQTGKTMGIETLTIFPKQVIDGKTIITA